MMAKARTRRLQLTLRSVQELASGCAHLTEHLPRKGIPLLARDPINGQEQLVFGADALGYAAHAEVESLACLIVVLNRDDPQREQVARLDAERVKDLDWLARASETLRRLPLALEDVSTLMGLSGRAEAQRVCRLGRRSAPLRAAANSAKVTRGHLRYLSPLVDTDFARWVLNVGKGNLSVHALGDAIKAEKANAVGGEFDSYVTRLSEALGTEVKIAWPLNKAARSVKVRWFNTEDLLGVLQKLVTAGGEGATDTPSLNESRRLTLHLRTVDELDAVFGQLGAER